MKTFAIILATAVLICSCAVVVPRVAQAEGTVHTQPVKFKPLPRFDGLQQMRINVIRSKTEKVLRVADNQFQFAGAGLTSVLVRAKHGAGKPPAAGVETVVDLVGPTLATWGERWTPNRLLSDGKKFFLIVDWWREFGIDGTSLTVPCQHYTISLGKLPAGVYEFSIYTSNLGWRPPRYRFLMMDHQPQVKFKVTSTSVETIPPTQKSPTRGSWQSRLYIEEPASASSRLGLTFSTEYPTRQLDILLKSSRSRRQRPGKLQYSLSRELPLVQRLHVPQEYDEKATAGVRIGSCNLARIWKQPPKKLTDVPTLQPAKFGERINALLLGPVLDSDESMNLREIEWVGRQVILRVDLWRHGAGPKKPHYLPLLMTPLQVDGPGNCEVVVEWSLLYKPQPQDLLWTRYMPKTIVDAPVDPNIKQSFLACAKNVSHANAKVARGNASSF